MSGDRPGPDADGDAVAPGRADPPAPIVVGGWLDATVAATAWALLALVPLHVVASVLAVDPGGQTAADALVRWDRPGWRALDWVLVTVGLTHAAAATARHLLGRATSPRTVVAGVVVLGAVLAVAAFTVAVLVPPQ